MPSDERRISPDKFYSVPDTAVLEDAGQSEIWKRLAKGEYDAVKDGNRTKIPGSSILKRRDERLRPATYKAPTKQPNRFHTIRRAADASTA
jgi:hypothetical protein